MRRWFVAGCLWLALVASVRADEPDEVYTHLVDAAVDAFVRGEWAASRELFARAQVVRPNARALRGLGMADFNLHAYALATAELEDALGNTQQPLDAELRAQVEALLERARPYVARVTFRLLPEHTRLSIDRAPPLRDAQARVLLDLGEHTLRRDAEGYLPRSDRIVVRQGGDATLALTPLAAVARPRERPVLRWVLLGTGLSALGVGIGTRVGSTHRFDELERSCRARAGCLEGEADLGPTRRLERTSAAMFGVGAALTISALVWWWLEPRTETR